jgi:hypothetical protein
MILNVLIPTYLTTCFFNGLKNVPVGSGSCHGFDDQKLNILTVQLKKIEFFFYQKLQFT